MEYLIFIGILFLATLGYLVYNKSFDKKAEIERLREVVRAIKAKDAIQYEEVLPTLDDIKMEKEIGDEFIDLTEVPPDELLKSLKR